MQEHPNTHYGAAKLASEARLRSRLGDRLTILRLSNIFDPSEADRDRRSFFGLAMRRLRHQGEIFFDMSPFVQRDFLPALVLAERLITIARDPAPGIFNLGAGFPVATGRIAQWLIEGYGSGRLVVGDFREFDSFYLDVEKATNTWGFDRFSEQSLRDHCLSAGATIAGVALLASDSQPRATV
jgi:dTDP-4-dehydrorhamnose reductase/UDP-glucose 4-epimerase